MCDDGQATTEVAGSTYPSNGSTQNQSNGVWCKATNCRANFKGQKRTQIHIFDWKEREDFSNNGLESTKRKEVGAT